MKTQSCKNVTSLYTLQRLFNVKLSGKFELRSLIYTRLWPNVLVFHDILPAWTIFR